MGDTASAIKLILLAVALFLIVTPTTSVSSSTPADNVLIVVNNASSDSISVGRYYQLRRGVPESQIVYLNTTTSITISCADYASQIETPVKDFLDNNGLKSKILYIVTTYGIPYKGCNAVDSRLADPYHVTTWQGYGNNNPYRRSYYNTYSDGKYQAGVHFSNSYGIYLVTRIDGPSAEIAKGLVDKAIYAENYGIIGAKAYVAGQPYLTNAIPVICAPIQKAGYSCVSDSSHNGGPNATWHTGGGNDYENKWAEWRPGSLAAHFQSFTASTTIRDTKGTKVVPAMLAAGVTGTWGAVAEPYAPFVPQPVAYYDYFLNGENITNTHFNFAESMYMSTYLLDWMSVIIGDPLYTLPQNASIDDEAPSITDVSYTWNANNLTVSWNNYYSAAGSPEITYGSVEYGLTENYINATWDTSPLTYWNDSKRNYFSTHAITIPNLDPASTYYLRINATDPANNTASYTLTTNITGDTTPPSVALSSPANAATITSDTVAFSCPASDNVRLSNVTLYGSWQGWHANDTQPTGTFTKTLPDGTHTWNCLAYDNSSNSRFATSNYTFTIDTVPPAPYFVPPTPANNSITINVAVISIRASETLSQALLEWNRTRNITMNNSGPLWMAMIQLPPAGNYSYQVYAKDTAGNWNRTAEMRTYMKIVRKYDLGIRNKFGSVIENSTIKVYNSGLLLNDFRLNASSISRSVDLEDTKKYGVLFALASGEALSIQSINISANATMNPQFVDSYEGELPASTAAESYAIALNPSGIIFDSAEITLPLAGTINRILHCTDWDFTSAKCLNWDSKDLSAYPYRLNSTHIIFNVTEFDAYMAGHYTESQQQPAPVTTSSSGGGGGGSTAATETTAKPVLITSGNSAEKASAYLKTYSRGQSLTVSGVQKIPVPAPHANVYKYFSITAVNISDSIIDNATIEFNVSKSEITSKKVKAIYLMRYHDGKWVKLPTELKASNSNYNTYAAYSGGFSYFAIVEELEQEQQTPAPAQNTAAEIRTVSDNEIPEAWANPPEEQKAGYAGIYSFIFVLVLIICAKEISMMHKRHLHLKEIHKKVIGA